MIVCLSDCTLSLSFIFYYCNKILRQQWNTQWKFFLKARTRTLLNSRHFKYHKPEFDSFRLKIINKSRTNKQKNTCMCIFHVSRITHYTLMYVSAALRPTQAGEGVGGCKASFLILWKKAWVHRKRLGLSLSRRDRERVFNYVDGVWTALKWST